MLERRGWRGGQGGDEEDSGSVWSFGAFRSVLEQFLLLFSWRSLVLGFVHVCFPSGGCSGCVERGDEEYSVLDVEDSLEGQGTTWRMSALRVCDCEWIFF